MFQPSTMSLMDMLTGHMSAADESNNDSHSRHLSTYVVPMYRYCAGQESCGAWMLLVEVAALDASAPCWQFLQVVPKPAAGNAFLKRA